jgi:flagellar biosynthesis/type III secretory pathway M-ring protein FliF/YscJ
MHALGIILGNHRRIALALILALAFAVIAALTLYAQARTGTPLGYLYHGHQPAIAVRLA